MVDSRNVALFNGAADLEKALALTTQCNISTDDFVSSCLSQIEPKAAESSTEIQRIQPTLGFGPFSRDGRPVLDSRAEPVSFCVVLIYFHTMLIFCCCW